MLTPQFEELFRRLLLAYVRYDDASRNPDNVVELARRRFALETLRIAVAAERDVIEAATMTSADTGWLAGIGVTDG